jgi:hypothetical protein
MKTLAFDDSFVAPAPPERVFPLLCPVREYDWLERWRCEVLHTRTGVAALDCIFRTDLLPGEAPMTWVVTRYEPPSRIEFTCFVPERLVMRLDISLEPAGTGATRLHWSRRFFSLTAEGDGIVEARAAIHRPSMLELERALVHYLETGAMLRATS